MKRQIVDIRYKIIVRNIIEKSFFLISIIRSYIFCFRYMPRELAVRCPVLIHWKVKSKVSPRAKIIISENINKYDIKIGFGTASYELQEKGTRFFILHNSTVIFNGSAIISPGTNIFVRNGGTLSLGDKFFCNGNCNILTNRGIYLGNEILMGWNITILDSDGHPTFYQGKKQESSKEIYIKDHCWIGSHSAILKGVNLATGTIIPYGCTIYKSNYTQNCIFNNKPMKVDMTWQDC